MPQSPKTIKIDTRKYHDMVRSDVNIITFPCLECYKVSGNNKILETYIDGDKNVCQINHCWCRTSETVSDKLDEFIKGNEFYNTFPNLDNVRKVIIEQAILYNGSYSEIYRPSFFSQFALRYMQMFPDDVFSDKLKDILQNKLGITIIKVNDNTNVVQNNSGVSANITQAPSTLSIDLIRSINNSMMIDTAETSEICIDDNSDEDEDDEDDNDNE